MSRKRAKNRTSGRKLRSTGTKARTHVDRIRKPPADLEQQLQVCRRELAEAQEHLAEALEQQTATSEVLGIISSSPGGLEPVFQTMLANATRICAAKFGVLWLVEGDAFRAVALHNAPPAFAEERRREPMVRPGPEHNFARLARSKDVVHIPDILADAQAAPVLAKLTGARALLTVPMLKDCLLYTSDAADE